MKLRFQKGDLAAIAAVLLLAVGVFFLFLPGDRPAAAAAEIYLDGKPVQTLSLTEPTEVTVTDRYTNTITVRNGAVAVTASDCPGTDCVSCGWIDSTGRSIVCLPNRLEIRIVGAESDVDFVVR